jgi:hypothetical protein
LHCFTLQGASEQSSGVHACCLGVLNTHAVLLQQLCLPLSGSFTAQSHLSCLAGQGKWAASFPSMQAAWACSYMQAQLPNRQTGTHAAACTKHMSQKRYCAVWGCTAPVSAGLGWSALCKRRISHDVDFRRGLVIGLLEPDQCCCLSPGVSGVRVAHFSHTQGSWKVASTVDLECRVKAGS